LFVCEGGGKGEEKLEKEEGIEEGVREDLCVYL
jgi:hypothetical protein